MDILYTLASKPSLWNNNEIRYSFRALEKFCPTARVFVAGPRLGWFSDAVTVIPAGDRYAEKHKTQLYKILYAMQNSDIADKFLVSSDDHFLCKPMDDNYPLYSRGMLCETGGNYFKDSCNFTYKWLQEHALPTYNFAQHNNMWFDKRLLEYPEYIEDSFKSKLGLESYSLMGNLICHIDKVKPVFYTDHKVSSKIKEAEFKQILDTSPIWSMTDAAFVGYPGRYLKRTFVEKSHWEK